MINIANRRFLIKKLKTFSISRPFPFLIKAMVFCLLLSTEGRPAEPSLDRLDKPPTPRETIHEPLPSSHPHKKHSKKKKNHLKNHPTQDKLTNTIQEILTAKDFSSQRVFKALKILNKAKDQEDTDYLKAIVMLHYYDQHFVKVERAIGAWYKLEPELNSPEQDSLTAFLFYIAANRLKALNVSRDQERNYLDLAKKTYPQAYIELGLRESHYDQANLHYQKAMEMGSIDAMVRLSVNYSKNKLKAEARSLLKEAGKKGSGKAYFHLTELSKSDKRKRRWLLKGATLGDPSCLYRSAWMLIDEKNYAGALKKIKTAKKHGYPWGDFAEGYIYATLQPKNELGLSEEEASKKALEIFETIANRKPADANHVRACFTTSMFYYTGKGVPTDVSFCTRVEIAKSYLQKISSSPYPNISLADLLKIPMEKLILDRPVAEKTPLYQEGYSKGYKQGYNEGYNIGYEVGISRGQASARNGMLLTALASGGRPLILPAPPMY